MITFLFNLIYAFLDFLIGLFPSSSGFSSHITNAFSTVGDVMYSLNSFVPLSDIRDALLLVLGVELLVWKWHWIKSLISHIPFVGGHH